MNPSRRKKLYRAGMSGGTEETVTEAKQEFKAEVLTPVEPVKEVVNPQITDAVTQVPAVEPVPVKKSKKTAETVTDPAV